MKRIVIGILLFLLGFFPVNFPQYENEWISVIGIIALSIPAYYFFIREKKFKQKAIFTIIAISIFAVIIETIGIITGFPYSKFFYGDSIGLKLFGITPFTILFTFTPVVLGSTFIASKIIEKIKDNNENKLKNFIYIKLKKTNSTILFFFFSVLFLVIYDLLLDPVAAKLGFWIWPNGGEYFEIPLMNYFGWIFSGLIATGIYYFFMKDKTFLGQETSLYYSTFFFLGAAFFLELYIPFIFGVILILTILKINK